MDIDDPALLEQLAGYARAREERMERMIERLRRIGAPVDLERVRDIAGHGTLGRPHLARALVEAGYAIDLSDAFARYIGGGKPAYVPRPLVDPRDAIALVRAAGGVTVLAHPFSVGGWRACSTAWCRPDWPGWKWTTASTRRGTRYLARHRRSAWADRHRRE